MPNKEEEEIPLTLPEEGAPKYLPPPVVADMDDEARAADPSREDTPEFARDVAALSDRMWRVDSA